MRATFSASMHCHLHATSSLALNDVVEAAWKLHPLKLVDTPCQAQAWGGARLQAVMRRTCR